MKHMRMMTKKPVFAQNVDLQILIDTVTLVLSVLTAVATKKEGMEG